jgi:hypothetical protein
MIDDSQEQRQANEPIDHHYLPIFYLKQWCGPDGKVVRYYRPYRKVVPSPVIPQNTGYEPRLNTLEGLPPEVRASIETDYMGPQIDQPASEALSLLLSFKLPTTDPMKRAWARFLMSLALRNPQTLGALNADMRWQLVAQQCIKPEAREKYRASGDPRGIEAWLDSLLPHLLKSSGTIVLPQFIEELSKPFHAMRWFLFDLGGADTSLLTSDRPLFGPHGFGDPRCIVALPLSPRVLFVAANTRESFRAFVRGQPPEAIVNLINETLVTQATAHVYGNTKAHLATVEKYLRPK